MIRLLSLLALIGIIAVVVRALWKATSAQAPGNSTSDTSDTGLSPEERQRIYREEKARIEAREAIEGPRRRKRWLLVVGGIIASVVLYFGIDVAMDLPSEVAKIELRDNPEAAQFHKVAVNWMLANSDVIRIGDLRSFTKVDFRTYKFDVNAVYREDTGLIRAGTLVCTVESNPSGYSVRLTHR